MKSWTHAIGGTSAAQRRESHVAEAGSAAAETTTAGSHAVQPLVADKGPAIEAGAPSQAADEAAAASS